MNWIRNFILNWMCARQMITTNVIAILLRSKMGLSQDWDCDVCWCNPPYGREIGRWVEKAYKTVEQNKNTVVMLLPARTDTKWFHEYIYGKAEVRFIKGRLKFGGAKNSAPFPSMVVVFRPELEMLEGTNNA